MWMCTGKAGRREGGEGGRERERASACPWEVGKGRREGEREAQIVCVLEVHGATEVSFAGGRGCPGRVASAPPILPSVPPLFLFLCLSVFRSRGANDRGGVEPLVLRVVLIVDCCCCRSAIWEVRHRRIMRGRAEVGEMGALSRMVEERGRERGRELKKRGREQGHKRRRAGEKETDRIRAKL